MSPESKRLFGNLGLLLGPVLLVKAAAAFLGADTATTAEAAPSAPVAGAVPALPEPRPAPAPALVEAAARVRAMAAQPMGPSPMLYKQAVSAAPAPAPVTVGRLEFVVQMVMQSGGQSVALINGTPYRVGDSIDGGPWRVSAIDIDARAVELTSQDTGVKQVGVVPRPGNG